MNTGATVSVVIPVFNGAAYLGAALDSVFRQTVPPFEVIVANDGSTDGTARLVDARSESLTHLALPRRGVGAALNSGVAVATGRWLCFLDADDLWPDDKLERQLAVMEREGAPDMLFGRARNFRGSHLEAAMAGLSKVTMMIRLDRFHAVGDFNQALRVGEFVDWYARARDAGLTEGMLEDVLLLRRVHDGNTGRDVSARQGFARVARLALERRRKAEDRP